MQKISNLVKTDVKIISLPVQNVLKIMSKLLLLLIICQSKSNLSNAKTKLSN